MRKTHTHTHTHKIIVFYIHMYISTQLCIQMKLDVMMDYIYILIFIENFLIYKTKNPQKFFTMKPNFDNIHYQKNKCCN